MTLDEISQLAAFAPNVRGKALVWALFETGARAEEFLNIRLQDVEDKTSHFLVRIVYPKTFRRTLPIHRGADALRAWLQQHPQATDRTAPVFPIRYSALRLYLQRLSRRALNKPVRPHLFRDSFATWLAAKNIGRYQMCKLMGWAMSSDMPDRYIDRAGVVEEETLTAIRGDELTKVERKNQELKAALQSVEAQYSSMQDNLQQRAKLDEFLTKIMQDKETRDALAQRIRDKDLGRELMDIQLP